MKKYQDFNGNEITEGTIIVWAGADYSEGDGVGNDGRNGWSETLKAVVVKGKLVFEDEQGKLYKWNDINDKSIDELYIGIKK